MNDTAVVSTLLLLFMYAAAFVAAVAVVGGLVWFAVRRLSR